MSEDQGANEANTTGKAVRWLPLACPLCRGVFRIKKSQFGHALCCPLCENNLLTSDGEVAELDPVTSFAAAKIETVDPTDEVLGSGRPGRKKHHVAAAQNALDWEARGETDDASKISPMGVLTVILIFTSLVGVGLYMWKVNVAKTERDAVQRALLEDAMALPRSLNNELETRAETEIVAEEKEAGKLNEIVSTAASEQMTERVKLFLEAETVAEKAKYVRDYERVRPLMEDYYSRVPYEPEGFRKLGESRELAAGNSIIATVVRVEDFTDYPIGLEFKNDEWLVDWESWVGYGEMLIDELREKKPSEEVLVRVMISSESYYNYEFNKEAEWSSYRLRFKDSYDDLWGYVKRGSPEEAAIVDQFQSQKEKAMQLKIKYPENPRNSDQVIISKVLGDGWLRMPEDENKEP